MVNAVVSDLLGSDRLKHIHIFSSDLPVPKKPNPDMYLYAADSLNVNADNCIAIEDSELGLKASLGANIKTVITLSTFSRNENFNGAEVIVENLEEFPGKISASLNLLESILNKNCD